MDATMEKVISKVRKLLALSKSSNEHEAASAAAKAAEMLNEHQLSEAACLGEAQQPDEPADKHVLDASARKRVAWRGSIAHGCAIALGCKMYWHGPRIMLIGRKSDVQSAHYLHAAICGEVDRLADARYDEHGRYYDAARAWKNAFRVGAAQVIQQRLQRQAREARERLQRQAKAGERLELSDGGHGGSASTALVVVDARALSVESAWRRVFPKERKAARLGSTSSHSGYAAGRAAGERVSLGGGGKALSSGAKRLGGV